MKASTSCSSRHPESPQHAEDAPRSAAFSHMQKRSPQVAATSLQDCCTTPTSTHARSNTFAAFLEAASEYMLGYTPQHSVSSIPASSLLPKAILSPSTLSTSSPVPRSGLCTSATERFSLHMPARAPCPLPRCAIQYHNAAVSLVPHIEHAPEAMIYKVEVVTGDRRGAGTSCPAVVRLIGSSGSSESFVLGDEDQLDGAQPGFDRGSHRTYLLSIDMELGDIQRMEVRQVQSGVSELGTGWFLERIDVTLPSGERLTFPCGHWIGKSDETDMEGPRQRNLIPCCLVQRPTLLQTGTPIMVSASAMAVPHPEKVAAGTKAVNRRGAGHGGEDAYFYTQSRGGVFALGVADGIYSWKTQGIDSGEFARQLMGQVHHLFDMGYTDVLALLQEAERRLRANSTEGSSTVCIVLIDLQQGRLTSANLGDSGFLVLGSTPSDRHLHVKYRSPQQEHEFGFPFQLGHHTTADSANDAVLMTLPVIPGDIVVLGSDGLFDNVSDGEMVTIAQQLLRENCCTPSELARCLLHNAYHNSHERTKTTPYSQAASEVFDMVYSGGKKDDITVVVAKVVDAQSTVGAASAAAPMTPGGLRGSERRA